MKTCKHCGDQILSKEAYRYCSKECRERESNIRNKESISKAVTRLITENPNYRKDGIIKPINEPRPCEQCNTIFTPKLKTGKYCSVECAKISNPYRKVKDYSPRPCEQCAYVYKPKVSTSKYCSHECKKKSSIIRGKNKSVFNKDSIVDDYITPKVKVKEHIAPKSPKEEKSPFGVSTKKFKGPDVLKECPTCKKNHYLDIIYCSKECLVYSQVIRGAYSDIVLFYTKMKRQRFMATREDVLIDMITLHDKYFPTTDAHETGKQLAMMWQNIKDAYTRIINKDKRPLRRPRLDMSVCRECGDESHFHTRKHKTSLIGYCKSCWNKIISDRIYSKKTMSGDTIKRRGPRNKKPPDNQDIE